MLRNLPFIAQVQNTCAVKGVKKYEEPITDELRALKDMVSEEVYLTEPPLLTLLPYLTPFVAHP